MCIFQSKQVTKLRFWLKKPRWYLSRQISICWIIMGGSILGRYMSKPTNIAELKIALLQYGMICHRSSLIRQSCLFERDFDFVLLQLADTLNTQFKYQEGSWHSLLKRLKYLRESCTEFDSLSRKIYWIFRTRLHVHLKKWNLKFKLLYLWNRICYFNKFAGYVDWILICKLCKFGKYLCNK